MLWHCWLGLLTRKTRPHMTYNVFGGTLNLIQPTFIILSSSSIIHHPSSSSSSVISIIIDQHQQWQHRRNVSHFQFSMYMSPESGNARYIVFRLSSCGWYRPMEVHTAATWPDSRLRFEFFRREVTRFYFNALWLSLIHILTLPTILRV